MIGIKDGKLVTEFCANRADPLTSLNFKRAIASLFQVITENGEYVSTTNSIIYCTSIGNLSFVRSLLRTKNIISLAFGVYADDC
jgi:hypothetical protein